MMVFNKGAVAHSAIISLVAEVGDKSFFLLMLLAIWCPIAGVRHGEGSCVQQILSAAGGVLALTLRLLMAKVHFNWIVFDFAGDIILVVLLVLLAVKAYLDYRGVEPAKFSQGKSARTELPKKLSPGSASGYLVNFRSYDPEAYRDAMSAAPEASSKFGQGYGTANLSIDSAGQRFEARTSYIGAFAIPFAMVFMAEIGDKSQWVLQNTRFISSEEALGTVLGYLASTTAAVFLGFLLERHLQEQMLLCMVAGGLCCLGLVTMSQTALHIHSTCLEFLQYRRTLHQHGI